MTAVMLIRSVSRAITRGCELMIARVLQVDPIVGQHSFVFATGFHGAVSSKL